MPKSVTLKNRVELQKCPNGKKETEQISSVAYVTNM